MAKDPYKYFRVEARELLDGLARGLLALEKGAVGKEHVGGLLRMAHTLKGAARVVKQIGIADLAHKLEDLLAPHREGRLPMPKEAIGGALQLVDAMTAAVARLAAPSQEPSSPPLAGGAAPAAKDERFETVRLEIGDVDSLLEGISETASRLNLLRREIAPLERATRLAERILEQSAPLQSDPKARALASELRDDLRRLERAFGSGFEEQERGLAQMKEKADELRLLPAGGIFSSLERAVRDAAQSLGKEIEFQAGGGDIRLDGHVLQAVRDALVHVARNAVGHGIEGVEERAAAGKPPRGRVTLLVERRGNRVAFAFSDDGRGIDIESIRRVALRRGLAPDAALASMTLEDAVQLLLRGGVSTTAEITELSGRGIGLDAVRETAARLKGEVRVRSRRGEGASVELIVPVSLSSLTALVVAVSEQSIGLPMDSIRGVHELRDQDIARSPQGDSISFRDKIVPFVALGDALGLPQSPAVRGRAKTVVLVESRDQTAAFGVDKVLGAASIVLRPAPRLCAARAVVSGVALNAEGDPQLIIEAQALLAAGAACKGSADAPSPPRTAPILVVDDSLTTRMLEQSILESAGYEVELAASGEEALGKARGGRYSLFIVDVEMPGMDGFQFLEAVSADAELSRVPAILVSSRNSPEDFRRGRQVGAKSYIVKSEFDQGALLETISGLIG